MAAHCDTYLVNKHDDRHKVYAISVIGQRTVIIFDVTIVLVINNMDFLSNVQYAEEQEQIQKDTYVGNVRGMAKLNTKM